MIDLHHAQVCNDIFLFKIFNTHTIRQFVRLGTLKRLHNANIRRTSITHLKPNRSKRKGRKH